MPFGIFIFLVFYGGFYVGSHAHQAEPPPPAPIEIKTLELN